MRLSCLELIMEGGRLIFRRELPLVPPKCQEGDYSIEGLGQDQGNTREGRNQPEHLYVITYMSPLVRYREMVSGNIKKLFENLVTKIAKRYFLRIVQFGEKKN